MKNPIRIFMGGLLVAFSAANASGQELATAAGPTTDASVRVMNHHTSAVRVFLFDSEDRRFPLGTVEAGDYLEMAVSAEWVEAGAVQIKVFPAEGPRGLAGSGAEDGVKSSRLTLSAGDAIDFWIEPDLAKSMVRLSRK